MKIANSIKMSTKIDDYYQTMIMSTEDLVDNMKKSFEFWHQKYQDTLINYPLVWKKALESDPEIIKKIESWKRKSNQNTEFIIQQFLEMWGYAIRDSNFKIAKKSLETYEEFWKNTTHDQFRVCSEVLEMIEKYWGTIQSKNIE